ncbi:YqaA family protein [Rhodosalinus sediminis]|mgnify:FL=1|uniref:YqaA family protein n=1 Tax=Rhodosalinus sediminis TaxID=1940533 RepID=UPI00235475A6|nr:YqaA family protein [Rhodosalinus sediminis]
MLSDVAGLTGLFLAAFGAATVLPFQSEIVFAGMQAAGAAPVALLVVVASVGNTLGAVVNYVLGRGGERLAQGRWFPASAAQLARAQAIWARWGVWTLLLSWAPFGDAFTVIAGLMRTPVALFLVLVTLAKTGRYVVLAWATAAALGG